MYLLELPPGQWSALGEFVSIGVPVEDDSFLDKIIDRIGAHREPGPRIRATVQARNVLAILVTYGFPFEGHVETLDEGLDEVVRMCRRDLMRRLVQGIDDEEERKAVELLLGLCPVREREVEDANGTSKPRLCSSGTRGSADRARDGAVRKH